MKSEKGMKSSARAALVLGVVALLTMTVTSAQAADNIGTGGTITYTDSSGSNPRSTPAYVGGYVVHTFTNSGTLNIPVPVSASVLVVGGGGGGGKFGGGGGAGGLIYTNSFSVPSGNTTVTVGAGGAGSTTGGTAGGNGQNTVLSSITAIGGGGGGSRQAVSPFKANDGASGGSGGGASPGDSTGGYLGKGGEGTTGQGNAGGIELIYGWGGCGGGGASAAGGNASGHTAGNGGAGLTNSISGASVTYAGGGGGCTFSSGSGTIGSGGLGGGGAGGKNASGVSGTANTGGGGGGGDINAGQNGGNGGSGIVIVRYLYVSTISQMSSSDEMAYAADVSNSDLLTGLTATTTGWNLGNGSTTPKLNDGIHGRSFADAGNSVEGTWTTVGATAIYNIGLGSSNLGYTLNSIQTIAAWTNAGFGNQAYTVEVKLKGAGSYITLATVSFQPFTTSQGGATKVTLSNPSGVLASGVEYIKFTANSVNGGANSGAYVFRELDVFGTLTEDPNPPTVSSLSPSDNATAVGVGANLVVTFSKNVARGTGNITIKNLDTSELTVIPVGDSQVSVSNAVLTINPSNNLAASTAYAIHIDATAIKDLANNPFAGISDDATWNFTSGVPDLTPPTIVTRTPLDNAINVPAAINLVLAFTEDIARGTGNITIKNLSDVTQTVIPIGDSQISVSGAVLTINPTNDLGVLKNYAIRIDSGAITDLSGNLFPGISDDTSWNFTSATTPLRIMCLGDSITVGYTDNPDWANHPFKFGYRSGLYTCLTNAGYNFKLVGGSTEPWTGISGDPTHGGTYTPALDLRDVGQDGHRGYGGQSIGGINSAVAGYIATDTPDVILLLIGINGIGSGSPAALSNLVNTIVTAAPNARLIVAQITPLLNFNQSLYDYNIYIRDTLVPNYVAAGKKVSTVNLYSLFLTNTNDYSSAIAPNVLSNGINHPDNTHYDLMAQKWFEGIDALGLGPDNTPPTLVPSAIIDDKAGGRVAVNTLVTYTVTFSEDMDAGTVTAADFGNAGTAAITIGIVSETTPGVSTVQVTPTRPGTLRLQVIPGAVVKDVVGNPMATTPILDDTMLTVYSQGTLIQFVF